MLVRELIERLQSINMPTARVHACDADGEDDLEVTGLLVDEHHNIITLQTDDPE